MSKILSKSDLVWKFAEHSAGLKQNNFFIVRIHFSKTISKYITLNTINVLYSKLLENPFKGSVLTKLHNCRSEPKKKKLNCNTYIKYRTFP